MWEATSKAGLRETECPPWSGQRMWTPVNMSDDDKMRLQHWMTLLIGVPYSVTRALCTIGNKTYGTAAWARLEKYAARATQGATGAGIMKNVICSEAVVVAHQLAFRDQQGSSEGYFIALDASHTMPRDLEAYLRSDNRWTEGVIP